jgi:hypothetical protein
MIRVQFLAGIRDFSLLHSDQTKPAILRILWALSMRLKQPDPRDDHSPPSSAEVNTIGPTPPPQYVFIIKYSDFTFYLNSYSSIFERIIGHLVKKLSVLYGDRRFNAVVTRTLH